MGRGAAECRGRVCRRVQRGPGAGTVPGRSNRSVGSRLGAGHQGLGAGHLADPKSGSRDGARERAGSLAGRARARLRGLRGIADRPALRLRGPAGQEASCGRTRLTDHGGFYHQRRRRGQTAAAFKNVVAVAVALAEGLSNRLGESALVASYANARAAVFARGMLDMMALVEAQGGRVATVLGLAGAGDLYVTCHHGRNGRFGRLLGSGATVEGAVRSIGSTVEGVPNGRPRCGSPRALTWTFHQRGSSNLR